MPSKWAAWMQFQLRTEIIKRLRDRPILLKAQWDNEWIVWFCIVSYTHCVSVVKALCRFHCPLPSRRIHSLAVRSGDWFASSCTASVSVSIISHWNSDTNRDTANTSPNFSPAPRHTAHCRRCEEDSAWGTILLFSCWCLRPRHCLLR